MSKFEEVSSTAFNTDHYELTNLQSAEVSGVANKKCVFEVFARQLPVGRQYGVVCGIDRIIEALKHFTFTEAHLEWLAQNHIGNPFLYNELKNKQFQGDIYGYREGELYFPYSPILTIESTFTQAIVLETLFLRILNWDSGIASTAARMVSAAKGKSLLEFGSRRTHESSAIDAARAAYIAGFNATSNLAASKRYAVPTSGTAAHCFTLAHEHEIDAFRAQVEALGVNTTLLVDTYDTEHGIRNAIKAAGPKLGGIRIDSGDFTVWIPRARKLLNRLGAFNTKIIISGELDEKKIAEYSDLPVDGFGVGTKLFFPDQNPSPGFVYKLVEIEGRPVAKKAEGKQNRGGRKYAYRMLNKTGQAIGEQIELSPLSHSGNH